MLLAGSFLAYVVRVVACVDNATEPRSKFRCSVGMVEFRTRTTVSRNFDSLTLLPGGDPLARVVDADPAHSLLIDARGATRVKLKRWTLHLRRAQAHYLHHPSPMRDSMQSRRSSPTPSAWVERFLQLIKPGGLVLDLAAGNGRHVRLLRDHGFGVCAVDRDITVLSALAGPHCKVRRIDLETADGTQLGDNYDGIVVTNYLHRPLLPAIARMLALNGALIYETFACGNERFGRPRNPDFLLRPGELLEAFTDLTVVAFEQGEVSIPRQAVMQRLAAVRGPMGRLPA